MISRNARAVIGLLLGFVLVPLGAVGAEQLDAVVATRLTEPARVEPGTVQVVVTAIIRESMGVEYTAPLTLGAPENPGQAAAANLVLANTAGRLDGGMDQKTGLSASIAIRGMPNQAFAVSLSRTTRLNGARRNTGIAIVTHDAGSTPRVGPAGETKFVIAARIELAQNITVGNYTGTLDVIVSHN